MIGSVGIALVAAVPLSLGVASGAAGATTSAPSGVVAAAGATSATVSWAAPPAGSFAVAEYRVMYSTNGGSSWGGSRYTGTPVTTFTYGRLTAGSTYVFRVRAENSSTAGAWSAPSAPVTVGALTAAPPPSSAPASPPPAPVTTSPAPATSTPVTVSSPPPVPATSTASSTVSGPAPAGSWWRPVKGTSWQWQLGGTVDTSVQAAVFDIDGEQNTAATVSALHAKGARVICYFDAGGWENYRSDAAAFPASVLGNTMNGWPDERWIDIRQLSVVLPLMEARIADCKAKGFDAVEPDVVDGYTNNTGFPLTAKDQAAYNTALADIAHRYGLGVALKNDPEQAALLQPAFDFAIVEECVQYSECDAYSPFPAAGKAVLHVEYKGVTSTFCPVTKALGFSSMKKHLSLDAWREVCP